MNEKRIVEIFLSFLLSIFFIFFIICLYFTLSFYIHESGHIFGGIIGDVISGNQIQEYTISNWVPSPFPGLAMPQQTHNTSENTAFFILGGMYAEIIFSLFFCLLIYVTFNFKTKVWILVIPLFTTIRQFLSNFLCGTDNPFNHPYALCQENSIVSFLFRWFDYSLILVLFILIFPVILEELPYVSDKIRHFFDFTMNLIHIADTHLGLAAFNRLDPESGMNLREKQVYDNFLKAIDKIIQHKPDVLVHAGDLFDVVKPKTRAYPTVLEALDRLNAAGILSPWHFR